MGLIAYCRSLRNNQKKTDSHDKKEHALFVTMRLRFISLASLSVLVVIALTVGVINSVRHMQTSQDVANIVQAISDNGGTIPSISDATVIIGTDVTEETLYSYRYFSATVNASGEISDINNQSIASLSDQTIVKMVKQILRDQAESGQLTRQDNTYAYRISQSGKSRLVVVLDATPYFADTNELLKVSVLIGGASLFLFVLIFSAFSKRIIAPFVDNYQKQRRFITNAGHELKTPLAIISANNELMEMTVGQSEWTKSTADQVKRLTGLINGLVSLAKLEEQEDVRLEELDFSVIARDAAEDFKGPVLRDGKVFSMQIQEGIRVKAEEKSLFELVTLLVDNANKYCDPGGQVKVRLSKGKILSKAKLEVSNTYKDGKAVDYQRFFERFYREDESHHSGVSGYGIGLSMASSMVKLFKASITVSYKEDTITFTVLL